MSLDNICRACSVEAAEYELIDLFGGSGNLAKIYSQCTSLNVASGDGLPNHLCADCNAKLVGFNKFRMYCSEWDAYFRTNIKKESTDTDKIIEPANSEHMGVEVEVQEYYAEEEEDEDMQSSESPLKHVEIAPEEPDEATYEDVTVLSENEEEAGDIEFDGDDQQLFEELPIKDEETIVQTQSIDTDLEPSQTTKPETTLKKYICQDCGLDFLSLGHLQQHRKREHNPDERELYICDVRDCGKEYLRLQTLHKHMRMTHERPPEKSVVCELCGKMFKGIPALKKHTSVHTGILPYACTICPKKYVTKHKLKEHIMRHEGIKNHVCPVCGLRKTTPHELKIHMNYHTREKIWSCPQCPQTFSSIGNMQRHVKIVHCGIKDYPCTTCGRSFGKAETLKHHVMTHTGERPHECSICHKRFIQVVALQTHMKTHNKMSTSSTVDMKIEKVPAK